MENREGQGEAIEFRKIRGVDGVMADDTDGDVLAMLRGDSHCPGDVLTLATEAAAKGVVSQFG